MDSPRAPRHHKLTPIFPATDVTEACLIASVATATRPMELVDLYLARGLADTPRIKVESAVRNLVLRGMLEAHVSTVADRRADGTLGIQAIITYRLGPKAVLDA